MKKSLPLFLSEIYSKSGLYSQSRQIKEDFNKNCKFFFNISSVLDLNSLEESFHILQSYKDEVQTKKESQDKLKKNNSLLEMVYGAIKPNVYWMHMIKHIVNKKQYSGNNCHVYFYSENEALINIFRNTIVNDTEISSYEVYSSLEKALYYDKIQTPSNGYSNQLIFDDEIILDQTDCVEFEGLSYKLTLIQQLGDPADEKEEFRVEKYGEHQLVKLKTLKNISEVKEIHDEVLFDVNWPSEEYKIDFESEPNCTEKGFWNNVVAFPDINVGANHIKSARKVGRTIGIPTANIYFDRELVKSQNLYPGVYYGKSKLIYDETCKPLMKNHEEVMEKMKNHLNTEFDAIYSIGPPLQYDIQDFFYEVLILNKFPVTDFYGLKISSRIQGFIRPMAKFPNFDSFIKAMWCDIKTAKSKLSISPKL